VEKSLSAILSHLKNNGLDKGKVRIAHCMNEGAAQKLKEMILAQMAQADVQIHRCKGLCSYYAEKGGLLIGFEKM
jgi:fatty acid-binding protein DegV